MEKEVFTEFRQQLTSYMAKKSILSNISSIA